MPVEPGDGPRAWERVLAAALEDPEEDGTTRLTVIAHVVDTVLGVPERRRLAGFPGGRPRAATVRAAAEALLARTGGGPNGLDDVARVRRLVALFGWHRFVARCADGSSPDLHPAIEAMVGAAELAAPLGAEAQAWALLHLAAKTRLSGDFEGTRRHLDRALAVLPGDGPLVGALIADALGRPDWRDPPSLVSGLLRVRVSSHKAVNAQILRDYDGAALHRDAQIEHARALADRRPLLLVAAHGDRSDLAQATGDVLRALALLDEQERLAHATGNVSVLRRHLLNKAETAAFRDDWEGLEAIRRERIRLKTGLPPGEGWGPEAVRPYVDRLAAEGRRAALTELGDDAYKLAGAIVDGVRGSVSASARDEARAWLDLAVAAWEQIETLFNGRIAVAYRRLELDCLDGRAKPRAAGRAMVELSRQWLRGAGKRRAALGAAAYGAPGDPQVLAWLEQLLVKAPPTDAAVLAVGVARWYLRAAQATVVEPLGALRRAVEAATRAMDGLEIPGAAGGLPVLLNASQYIDAGTTCAAALAGLRRADLSGGGLPRAELDVRLRVLTAVAQRFIGAATEARREACDRLYTPFLAETLELAVEAGDGAAADAVAEVSRRDRVGTILASMAAREGTPARVAELAHQLIATLNATATEVVADSAQTEGPGSQASPGTAGPPGEEEQDNPPAVPDGTRAAVIAAQRERTLDVLLEVVGPVAREVFDPTTAMRHTVAGALSAVREPGTVTAVLSLTLLTSGAASAPRLVRHLALEGVSGGPVDHLDIVDAPAYLPGLSADAGPAALFARLDRLTDVILPEPLRALLEATDAQAPVDLVVVPTGLLGLPLAALPLEGGRRVLDAAAVTVAQSLQSIEVLGTARPEAAAPTEVAVYDPALLHAEVEWAALRAARPGVRPAASLEDMAAVLSSDGVRGGPGLLALGVHGERATDGWRQVKRLPSGQVLHPGHVMEWSLPGLVVGASCNTDIRTDAGGDLGGFPLAFQMRGASTIVGALYYIEDEATAEIMGRFYRHLAAGVGAARALRAAQREWIAVEPGRATQQQRWSYLVAYGTPGRPQASERATTPGAQRRAIASGGVMSSG